MEMIKADKDDYPAFTVYDYYKNPVNRPFIFTALIPKARRLLIMLAQLGFLHNDFHLNNLLCQEAPPIVYIIDFGRATRISEEQIALFNSYLAASNLNKMIPFLFGNISFMENPKYKWFQWLHKNSLDPLVPGFAPTIAISSEESVLQLIRLKKAEMEQCLTEPAVPCKGSTCAISGGRKRNRTRKNKKKRYGRL
jgi:hypothetical protein